MTGGADFTFEDGRHRLEAVNAGIAYPHYGVDVRVLLQAFDFHLAGSIDEHDDVVRASLGFFDYRLFLVGKTEDVVCIGVDDVGDIAVFVRGGATDFAGIEACALAADSADDYNCRVAVFAVVEFLAGYIELFKRRFGGVGGAVSFHIDGSRCAVTLAAPRHVRRVIFVCLKHLGIDVERLAEGILQTRAQLVGVLYGVPVGNAAARRAAVVGYVAADTEESYLGFFARERERIVFVLQKHERFGRLADGKLLHAFNRVFRRGVLRAVSPFSVFAVHHYLRAGSADVFVERLAIRFEKNPHRNGHDEHESEEQRDPAKHSCFDVHFFLLYKFFYRGFSAENCRKLFCGCSITTPRGFDNDICLNLSVFCLRLLLTLKFSLNNRKFYLITKLFLISLGIFIFMTFMSYFPKTRPHRAKQPWHKKVECAARVKSNKVCHFD